ncbi:DUF4244 domain-containing protein [Nocardioides agariphilus]|jgi:hypothetical protein|uniref:DUF4244 domain-containing protein n=1 Tax=Nocardioides agariphilus TaxID=433664 RepID=A0A930VLL0_9ACTN|nr:DUF4244 domain-containing protein [Nocardioides agariphilus]MBF4767851.1 DUF4244 domain-containing protein [Nocardioides agariphilus]
MTFSRREVRGAARIIGSADERGITTAEYAVGTAAGAGLAGVLYKLLTSGFGEKLLKMFFEFVLSLLGIG